MSKIHTFFAALAALATFAGAVEAADPVQVAPAVSAGAPADLNLHLTVDSSRVPVGKSVILTANARRAGQPVPSQELWAYVDGRQWGAQRRYQRQGHGNVYLPLPWTGTAQIQVASPPPGFAWSTDAFGKTSELHCRDAAYRPPLFI